MFPDLCVICKRNAPTTKRGVCRPCQAQLAYITPPYCRGCGGRIDGVLEVCGECIQNVRPWRQAYTVFELKGVSRELIHRFKYAGDLALTGVLVSEAVSSWDNGNTPTDRYRYIVAVPMHWLRRMQRGYNQAWILAQEFSAITGIPCLDILRRKRWTASQSKLNLKQREKNLKNAFSVNPGPDMEGAAVLMIDDVFTTGATLTACAKILLDAGAANLDILTIARG